MKYLLIATMLVSSMAHAMSDGEIKDIVCEHVQKNIKHPWYEESDDETPDYVFGDLKQKGSNGRLYSKELERICGVR